MERKNRVLLLFSMSAVIYCGKALRSKRLESNGSSNASKILKEYLNNL